MSQCRHMKDGLGTTTWSRAWIIEALLWINQKHECTVQALVVWSCDWVGGRDGGRGPAPEPRMRRMGGFQCPSLFASASETFSSHAASCDCGGVWICASSSSSPCPCEGVGCRRSNRAAVAVDPVVRCGDCGERAGQMSKVVQDMWVFLASVVPSRDTGRVGQFSVIVVLNAS